MNGPAPLLLSPRPLEAAAFAPYGQVIEPGAARRVLEINGGTARRFHDLARIEPGPEGRVLVSIFQAVPRQLPLPVTLMERHPLASQAFMPLSGRPYLVLVAAPGEELRAAGLQLFLAPPGQGVNFNPGTWHHPLLALEGPSDFLVIDREGPGNNCEERALDQPCAIAAGRA